MPQGDHIVLITCKEPNETTDREELIVSHGVDPVTDRSIPLPGEHPAALGGRFDPVIGEWVLDKSPLEKGHGTAPAA